MIILVQFGLATPAVGVVVLLVWSWHGPGHGLDAACTDRIMAPRLVRFQISAGESRVNGDIEAILAQIPKDQGISAAVWEFLEKEIRSGGELNPLQRESVWAIVNTCVGKNLP